MNFSKLLLVLFLFLGNGMFLQDSFGSPSCANTCDCDNPMHGFSVCQYVSNNCAVVPSGACVNGGGSCTFSCKNGQVMLVPCRNGPGGICDCQAQHVPAGCVLTSNNCQKAPQDTCSGSCKWDCYNWFYNEQYDDISFCELD